MTAAQNGLRTSGRSTRPADPPPDAGNTPTRATQTQTGASCNGCGTTWTGLSRAHCAACHRTFAAAGLFDRHRSTTGDHGTCLNPATLTNANGERVMFHRDGMWRGPELTDEQKNTLFGR
jgi:hypothetical protein